MALNLFELKERESCAKLAALLVLPSVPAGDEMYSDGECFDPWDMFPAVYGSYSSDFDDMAIETLTDIRDMTHKRADLASEMFREMLCTLELCHYGTSPRACFASSGFEAILPRLIDRWQEYKQLRWKS